MPGTRKLSQDSFTKERIGILSYQILPILGKDSGDE